MENMEAAKAVRDARDALRAAEYVETRATETTTSKPWAYIIPTGIAMGLAFFTALMEQVLITFLLIAGTIVLVWAVEGRRKSAVRISYKQEVRPDDTTWSWTTFLFYMASYTVLYVGLQFLPRNNIAVAATAGTLIAIVFIVATSLTWGRVSK
ncbi:hypothetical protein [Corynebacterium sp. HMSC29G08]|uniref:hypothetical protein n=1 Tax=Corynebacterium sp. HMSC29G08 TaxID=1581069 RepID=UPI0008CB1DA7|nr:hypothetical protein [Corynebacterium sp. HMSC29G08]OFT81040.1 hypothetical protein HMPREF3101_10900 [Corynebacterium sp. HMSC29G08]